MLSVTPIQFLKSPVSRPRWFCTRLVLLAVASLCTSAAGNNSPSLRVIEHTTAGWTLEYLPGPFETSLVTIEGKAYTLVNGAGEGTGPSGIPRLPVETVNLGIPFGSSISVELSRAVYETLENQFVAPVPERRITDEGEALDVFLPDPRAYTRNHYYPERQVEVASPYTLRHQRVGTINLRPWQYNPVTRQLRKLVSALVRVSLNITSPPEGTAAPDDPAFEPIYKSLMVNYEEARPWRRRGMSPVALRDSTRDWFEPGRTYYRIGVAQDGWYRISPADLAAAGADPSMLDPISLKMLYKGAEIPIVVRPDTSLEFHALRNRGDSVSIDQYTDTSAYWLTWGGSPGLRFTPVAQPPGPGGPTNMSSYATAHVELNTGYFTGTTELDVIENDEVPGEGWYWERIFPNSNTLVRFVLDGEESAGHRIALRIRLFSMTPDSPAVDHHARFWVNDSLAGEVMFEGRTGVVFSDSFPSTWLHPDSNSLRISSLETPSFPNLFYLDWFEIGFLRSLRTVDDMMEFAARPAPGAAEFRVSGFSSPDLEVRDVTGRREIIGGIVTGDSATGYALTFRDTLTAPRNYQVIAANTGMPVSAIERKQFRDIRTNPGGADYIIITHRLFSEAARRLAAHRSSVSGIRTSVIDVQEIYDEFSFGKEDPTAIRTFLRYTFERWPAPPPTTVLLLGDACWDPRGYLPTTAMKNYVPSHGVPAGDNWFVAFDSSIVPSMAIGRLPVQDSVQALRTVEKITEYDAGEPALWNKNFLMITGGISPGEQETFNSRSEGTIGSYLAPRPIGGTVFRAYKSSGAVVDGEHRERMRELVRDGLVFVNFLGHSGGRIWGVDIGDPSTLGNTNGRLPFICSVSCNIAAFAEPSGNVLAEDLVLADHRGAVAAWASSSLGYPTSGTQLVNFFLSAMRDDSLRSLGLLTTLARLRLYQSAPADPVVRAMVRLNPLIGDPLTRIALPLQADLALDPAGITISPDAAAARGGPLTLKLSLQNFGLVPADSVELTMTDLFDGGTRELYRGHVRPVFHADSLSLPWTAEPGMHTLRATLDPSHQIPEVNELNNSAAWDQYLYARRLEIVKPLKNQVVAPGSIRLVVTRASGSDPDPANVFFEVDTAGTFTSPMLASGPVTAGPVSGEWHITSLPAGRVFFWRARTEEGGATSAWVVSSFSTSPDVPQAPVVRLRQDTRALLGQNTLQNAAVTDSGIIVAPAPRTQLVARSLGSRANPAAEYFSFIRLNDVAFQGQWWEIGVGFMALRVDPLTGESEFRPFNVPGRPAEAESMTAFLDATSAGSYLAIVAILDGRTNVTPALVAALGSLGSTQIGTLNPGMSWALIARKGDPSSVLEGASGDSVVLATTIPAIAASGRAAILLDPFPVSTRWNALRWRPTFQPGVTDARMYMMGIRRDGGTDTLMVIPPESTDVSLLSLNDLAAPPLHVAVRPAFSLRTGDVQMTPVLREWSIDLRAPADVAVYTLMGGGADTVVPRGEDYAFRVHLLNIGYGTARRVPVTASYYDGFNILRPFGTLLVDSIAVGGTETVEFQLETADLPPRVRLLVSAWSDTPGADLIGGNNTASATITLSGARGGPVRLLADGRELMEGDYVAPRPVVTVDLPPAGEPPMVVTGVLLTADNAAVPAELTTPETYLFKPELRDGTHFLEVRALREGAGYRDTIVQKVGVQVESRTKIINLFNYPNPFAGETDVVFTVTGVEAPDEVVIRVFTVAGRKIREITVPGSVLEVGFNRVAWDGRDSEAEEIANGSYFYQVVVKGRDGTRESAIGKMAKLK